MKASCLPPNSAIESGRPYVTHMLEKGGLKTMRRQTLRGAECIPRWTPQKRPLIDTSKPAISGMAAETGGVLPRGLRGAQVGLDLRAPAAWPALEDMAMMQQAIQQGGDGRGVAE